MIVKLIAYILIGAVLLLVGVRFLKESDDELIANERDGNDIDKTL